jgi:prophage antirepressor-like protein
MNELNLIKHPDFGSIRTNVIDGAVLFCAKDVCDALDMSQFAESALRGLDEDEKFT